MILVGGLGTRWITVDDGIGNSLVVADIHLTVFPHRNVRGKEYCPEEKAQAAGGLIELRHFSHVVHYHVVAQQYHQEIKAFKFYGTQRIERKTSILTRQLITEGNYEDVPRTENNPHGCLITNWQTLLNKDISHTPKSSF